jgi:hypothetical protein
MLMAVLAFGAFLAGCGDMVPFGGSNETTANPSEPGTPAGNPNANLAVKDLNDTTITALTLGISPEYVPDTNMVDIYAFVKDQTGAELYTFNKYNFMVSLKNGISVRRLDMSDPRITLEGVLSGESIVALAIDSSGSMTYVDPATGDTRMQAAKDAAKLFVSLMGTNSSMQTDKTALIDFDTAARIAQGLTDDQTKLDTAIDSLIADGATDIGGAIIQSVSAIGSRPGKRAVVLLTDGEDNGGQINDGITAAQSAGIAVFTVALGTSTGDNANLSQTAIDDLTRIAVETGGQFFEAPDTASLSGVFSGTIPGAIAALPEMQALKLSVPNSVPVSAGSPRTVQVITSVSFENKSGTHRASSSGTYVVQ